jgi:hypothetical protein
MGQAAIDDGAARRVDLAWKFKVYYRAWDERGRRIFFVGKKWRGGEEKAFFAEPNSGGAVLRNEANFAGRERYFKDVHSGVGPFFWSVASVLPTSLRAPFFS